MQLQRSLRFVIGREQRSIRLPRCRSSPSRSTGRSRLIQLPWPWAWDAARAFFLPSGIANKNQRESRPAQAFSAVVEPKLGLFRVHTLAPRLSFSPHAAPHYPHHPSASRRLFVGAGSCHSRTTLCRGLPAFACVGCMPAEARCRLQGDVATSEGGTGGDSDALSQGLIRSKEQSSAKVDAVFDGSMNTSHERTIFRAMKF